MSNNHIDPTFAGIISKTFDTAPVADVNTYRVPTDTGELARLMGDVYRDAHATGYAEGFTDGDIQGNEDAQRAAAEAHLDEVERYGKLWTTAYRAADDLAAVIRQFEELTPEQILATLRGVKNTIQSRLENN